MQQHTSEEPRRGCREDERCLRELGGGGGVMVVVAAAAAHTRVKRRSTLAGQTADRESLLGM